MNKFRVRVHTADIMGFFTKADHYEDHEFYSNRTLEDFSQSLAQRGFHDRERDRWIMPGAILYIERVKA